VYPCIIVLKGACCHLLCVQMLQVLKCLKRGHLRLIVLVNCMFFCCQVEHIIVKPELETAFVRLFPGAVIKGQKVGIAFLFCYLLCIY